MTKPMVPLRMVRETSADAMRVGLQYGNLQVGVEMPPSQERAFWSGVFVTMVVMGIVIAASRG